MGRADCCCGGQSSVKQVLFLMWLTRKFFSSNFLFCLDLSPIIKSLQFNIYLLRVSSVQSSGLSTTLKSLNPMVKSYFAYINESISEGK